MANWDDFSNSKSALQLKANAIRGTNREQGYGNTQMAVVMSEPVPTSARDVNVVVQSIGQGGDLGEVDPDGKRDAFIFKIRLLPEAGKKLAADAALPCTDSLSKSKNTTQAAMRLSLLPDCVIKKGYDGEPPNVGDTIVVRTYNSDFQMSTGLQTTEYVEPANPSLSFRQNYDPEIQHTEKQQIRELFDSNSPTNVARGTDGLGSLVSPQEPSTATPDKTRIKFSFNDAYAMRNDFQEIKDYIKAGEGIYESIYGQVSGYKDPVNNQKVTEMTLSYLIGEAMPRIYKKNKTSTAAGAYQFLKGTLIETVSYFDRNQPPPPAAFWDSGPIIYNKANQDALVMHLLLVKRPIMGNYILGLHDNYTEAAQQMAYEWASIPIQYAVKSPLADCNKRMERGQGAYDGCAGNVVAKSKTPEGVVEILNTARKEAARNATVQDILRRNGKTATQDALAMAGLQEAPTETETNPDSVVTSEEGSTG